jgi:hypothetical protein
VSAAELSTPNLHLRRLEAGDLPVLVALAADERVMDPLGGTMTADKTAAWLDGLLAGARRVRTGCAGKRGPGLAGGSAIG